VPAAGIELLLSMVLPASRGSVSSTATLAPHSCAANAVTAATDHQNIDLDIDSPGLSGLGR
jgi:uncharacterized protein involved in propanediol utilization